MKKFITHQSALSVVNQRLINFLCFYVGTISGVVIGAIISTM